MKIKIYSNESLESQPCETTVILTPNCSFQHVFKHTEQRGNNILESPSSEVVYSRSDYDGHRWWTSWFQPHKERLTSQLIEEIDLFMNSLFKVTEFQTLDRMSRMCHTSAEKTGSDTEFNLYSGTEHLYIWLRLITRFRDYNLYVHFYQKEYEV